MAKNDSNTGMMLVISYFILFVVNTLVILGANALSPTNAVLGNSAISKTWAIIHSVGILTLINTFAIPFVREYEIKRGKMFTSNEWMFAYFVINFVGIWAITRFAESVGFGITSWMVALILAVVLDMVQGIAMMQLEKFRVK